MTLRRDVPAVAREELNLPVVNDAYEHEKELEQMRHAHMMEQKQLASADEMGYDLSSVRRSPMPAMQNGAAFSPVPLFSPATADHAARQQHSPAPGQRFTPASGQRFSPASQRRPERSTPVLLVESPLATSPARARVAASPLRQQRLMTQQGPQMQQRKDEQVKRSLDFLRKSASLKKSLTTEAYEKRLEFSAESCSETQSITVHNNTDDRVRLAGWKLSSPDSTVPAFEFHWDTSLQPGKSVVVWCTGEQPSDDVQFWWAAASELFGQEPNKVCILSTEGATQCECEVVGLPAPAEVPTGPALCLDPLTAQEEEEVRAAMEDGSPEKELVHFKKGRTDISMTREELQCLRPGAWLDDKSIEIYINLVVEMRDEHPELPDVRMIKNSFFYTKLVQEGYVYDNVKVWTKRMKDLLQADKILVPINKDGNHWVLAVINVRDKRFEFYDALPSGWKDFEHEVFGNLRRWLCDESRDKLKKEWDLTGWVDYGPTEIPHQQNGYDCGMFAVKYAQCMALDVDLESLPFGQPNLSSFRRRAVLEMMRRKIHV